MRYSKVLQRYLLDSDYESRKRHGTFAADASGKEKQAMFFRLDNGVAWVRAWDEQGEFVPGPWERWFLDERTGRFRKMMKGDDPEWQSRRSSRIGSSRANSTVDRSDAARGSSVASTTPASTRGTTASGVSTPHTPKSMTNEEISGELGRKLKGLKTP